MERVIDRQFNLTCYEEFERELDNMVVSNNYTIEEIEICELDNSRSVKNHFQVFTRVSLSLENLPNMFLRFQGRLPLTDEFIND